MSTIQDQIMKVQQSFHGRITEMPDLTVTSENSPEDPDDESFDVLQDAMHPDLPRSVSHSRQSVCRAWNPSYSWKQEGRPNRLVLHTSPVMESSYYSNDDVDNDDNDKELNAAELGDGLPIAKSDHSSTSPTNHPSDDDASIHHDYCDNNNDSNDNDDYNDDDNNDNDNNDNDNNDDDNIDNDNDNNDNDTKQALDTTMDDPLTQIAALDSKYQQYTCMVDTTQHDRSVEIQLGSFARPHMRAFHLAWMAFFIAFFTWFAITPLLSEVQRSLDLTRRQIWNSSIFAVAGSAITRIAIGPVCDKYGARWAMAGTLLLSAIPTAVTGVVQTTETFNLVRLMIGVAGSAFVTCQYWTSSMFTKEVAGTANALVAGWGNLGGGVTQIVMGSLLFPLFKIIYGGSFTGKEERPSELSWRTVCVVPALLCILIAYVVVQYSDDSPKGNVQERSRQGLLPSVSAQNAFWQACQNRNTWILFVQYGCCFGVEITTTNAAALYFKEEFGLSTESSAAIASLFGWMNLFARGVGGFVSDMANAKYGMRGRLWVQTTTLILEGALVLLFSKVKTLAGAIVVLIIFSIFVQATEGSTFGIVTYVNPTAMGSISGFVGAGGNVGGVVFSFIFREYNYRPSFEYMGWIVMFSALLTVLISIPGHGALCHGRDAPEVSARRSNHPTEQSGGPPSEVQRDQA